MAQSLASLIGATPEAAGWILGMVTIAILTFAFLLILDKGEMQIGLIFAGIFTAFVVGVEWWPVWAAIFVVLFIALAIMNPFENAAGG